MRKILPPVILLTLEMAITLKTYSTVRIPLRNSCLKCGKCGKLGKFHMGNT